MRTSTRYLVALLAFALLGALLAGCSGQQEASEESVDPEQLLREQLVSEVESAIHSEGYQSVTMDVEGSVSKDPSATADSAQTASDSEDGEYAEYDEAADEVWDEGEEGETGAMMTISAKCDRSGESVRMQTGVELGEEYFEMYVNGNTATMVMSSQAARATLAEFKMPQYADLTTIMRSQGMDISQFKDAVTDIQKAEETEGATYTVTCDPARFALDNASSNELSKLDKTTKLSSVELTYQVNAENLLVGATLAAKGTGYSAKFTNKFHDYNATDVEDGPEPTLSARALLGEGSDEEDAEMTEDGAEYYEDNSAVEYADTGEYADAAAEGAEYDEYAEEDVPVAESEVEGGDGDDVETFDEE